MKRKNLENQAVRTDREALPAGIRGGQKRKKPLGETIGSGHPKGRGPEIGSDTNEVRDIREILGPPRQST